MSTRAVFWILAGLAGYAGFVVPPALPAFSVEDSGVELRDLANAGLDEALAVIAALAAR